MKNTLTQLDDRGNIIIPGPKLKLTKKVQNKIFHAVNQGATVELLCKYAGVSQQTFRGWLNQGIADVEGGNNKSVEARFALHFAEMEAEAATSWLEHINRSAPEDWRAAAWLLERRHRNSFGKSIEVTPGEGAGIITVITNIPGPPGSNLKKAKAVEVDDA